MLAAISGSMHTNPGQVSSRHELITASSTSGYLTAGSDPNAETYAAADLPKRPASVSPVKAQLPAESRCLSSVTIGSRPIPLEAGFDLCYPSLRHFGLRGQVNFLAFDYLFSIDGVHYDSRFNLGSGSLSVDWYPRHRASVSVPAFSISTTTSRLVRAFLQATTSNLAQGIYQQRGRPVQRNAWLIFPRHVAPMVTFGLLIFPESEEGTSTMPIEFGVAYTGAAKINVTLTGTACTNEGCFSFADNEEAQQSLQDEIKKSTKP